jgi:hypothetical protein
MKKLVILFAGGLITALANTGCQQPKAMDEATMLAKADSAAKAQMQSVADAALQNCDANRAAWIIAKSDSIFAAEFAAMNTK